MPLPSKPPTSEQKSEDSNQLFIFAERVLCSAYGDKFPTYIVGIIFPLCRASCRKNGWWRVYIFLHMLHSLYLFISADQVFGTLCQTTCVWSSISCFTIQQIYTRPCLQLLVLQSNRFTHDHVFRWSSWYLSYRLGAWNGTPPKIIVSDFGMFFKVG